MAQISAEKRIVLVFFALYYKLKELRPSRYHFCKVYLGPNKCRKAHSSRVFLLYITKQTSYNLLHIVRNDFNFLDSFCSFFHILLKLTLKSQYVGISNLVKNVNFFIILPMFQSLNFCKKKQKKHEKNNRKR